VSDTVQATSEVNRDRLLQTFLDLVAIDSPTGHEEEIGHVLERLFGEAGCRVSRDEIGNVVAGTTDSFGPTLQLLHDGLGMIKGSYCPHYDAEDQRRPLFHAALLDGSLDMGYASWNRVAIRFTPDGEVVEAVTSEEGGRALKVFARDGEIVEEDIPCHYLEESSPSRTVST
jgi:hypothetical protein